MEGPSLQSRPHLPLSLRCQARAVSCVLDPVSLVSQVCEHVQGCAWGDFPVAGHQPQGQPLPWLCRGRGGQSPTWRPWLWDPRDLALWHRGETGFQHLGQRSTSARLCQPASSPQPCPRLACLGLPALGSAARPWTCLSLDLPAPGLYSLSLDLPAPGYLWACQVGVLAVPSHPLLGPSVFPGTAECPLVCWSESSMLELGRTLVRPVEVTLS